MKQKESPEHIQARMAAALAAVQQTPVTCRECHTEFIRSAANQKYCTEACLAARTARAQHAQYERARPYVANRRWLRGPQSAEHIRKRAESTERTMAMSTKQCPQCGTSFIRTSTAQVYCSGQCWNMVARQRRRNPPRIAVSPSTYTRLLAIYGNQCQVCRAEGHSNGRTDRLAVDHDHKTGAIRSLLCHRCNTALGLLNDSPDIAHQAFRYLAYHSSVQKEQSA